MSTPFRQALAEAMRNKIRELKREGTVGMSLANLQQVVATPAVCAGAPLGTNRQWHYARMFEEVAMGDRSIRAFLI